MNNETLSLNSIYQSIIKSHNFLKKMILKNKDRDFVPESLSVDFLCLLLFNSSICDDVKYSYLDDISISKDGEINIITKNKKLFLKRLNFLEEYADYRIAHPEDLAKA